MVFLRSDVQTFDHQEFIESFLQNKEPDCILYSREGTKFDIHKEILLQSQLMKNILLYERNICCQNMEMRGGYLHPKTFWQLGPP